MSRITKTTLKKRVLSWKNAMDEFLFLKKAQGISELTYDDYSRHISQFMNRFNPTFDFSILKTQLYSYLAQPDIKPSTYNNRLVYLRAFLNWCVTEDIISTNPLSDLKKRKDEGRKVNLGTDTLIKLLSLPNKSTFVGIRDFCLLLLTLDCGIRPKEAFALVPSDFNSDALEVYIAAKNAKTRVSRTLPISTQTAIEIKRLISVRASEWSEEVPIFCTYEGKSLNRHTWGDRLEIYSGFLGVHIRPYDLRHSFALYFLRNGANALTLQRILGHADLSMTKRYVALTNNDLKEQHLSATPISTLMPNKKRLKRI
ncbi:tyrosine-type recombinase/integrase [Cohnella sp. GCM10012308]|uniref:tyrosine-type recombinase/integrase n=1 Tax=Cohnella sp. GCM10012308 TaxID=3317329 RepID=UPI0036212DA0